MGNPKFERNMKEFRADARKRISASEKVDKAQDGKIRALDEEVDSVRAAARRARQELGELERDIEMHERSEKVEAKEEEASRDKFAKALMKSLASRGSEAQALVGVIKRLQSGGVTYMESLRIINAFGQYVLGVVDAVGSDVSRAHARIAANKAGLTALGNVVRKTIPALQRQVTAIDALVVKRGLEPSGTMRSDLAAGAIFFGEDGRRRADLTTLLLGMVAAKSMRLYPGAGSDEGFMDRLFVKADPVAVVTPPKRLSAGAEIPDGSILFIDGAGGFQCEDAADYRKTTSDGRAMGGEICFPNTVPRLAHNLGSFAKVFGAGWLSGKFENPWAQLGAFLTESVGSWIGTKGGDLSLTL